MIDMKCPVCNVGYVHESVGHWCCDNEFCPSYDESRSDTYDILITTKEKLLVCEECCRKWETDYHLEFEKNTRLENKLDRTRKALGIVVDALKSAKTRLELINHSKFANLNNVLQIQSQCEVLKINKALDQINEITKGNK